MIIKFLNNYASFEEGGILNVPDNVPIRIPKRGKTLDSYAGLTPKELLSVGFIEILSPPAATELEKQPLSSKEGKEKLRNTK